MAEMHRAVLRVTRGCSQQIQTNKLAIKQTNEERTEQRNKHTNKRTAEPNQQNNAPMIEASIKRINVNQTKDQANKRVNHRVNERANQQTHTGDVSLTCRHMQMESNGHPHLQKATFKHLLYCYCGEKYIEALRDNKSLSVHN